ncbi:NLR family CARD domain-containing protein 4-like [Diadema setosum]|uniref:NLR family CARD domain-containing protein 4-like n=1 Tax=Diadema setosum TaxID=31175 RepID=UPI003B3A54AF
MIGELNPRLCPLFAASEDEIISDKDIADVAESMGIGDLDQVGLALGISRAEILRHEATNFMSGRVTCKGTRDMLREWRSRTGGPVIELQRALRTAGVKFDFGRPELERNPSPKESVTLSESCHGITDVLLDNLSKNISVGDDFDALGHALGCTQAEISRHLATNSSFGRMTTRGTKDMLYAWRSRTGNADAITLKKVLLDARLVSLVEKYFQDETPPYNNNSAADPRDGFLDTKVTDTLTVRDLRQRLEDTYEHEHCHVQLVPWSEEAYVKLNDLYINIAVFKEGNKFVPGRGRERVKLNSVDDVFRRKFDGSLPMRIVVLAKAGTGKTTMVAKIAYDWKHAVEGSPLKDIPLLFVITMRRLKKDTSLGDAILYQLLQSMDGISGEDLENFIAANEDKCMLVLDGYDEYAGKICTKSSQDPHLCSSVIDVICNRKLRKCRTLVTSRFYRETDFNKPKFAFVKMTVEGFSDANIAEYVTQFFKEEPQMGKGLQTFLQINPLITELIHVPLFCVMLCDLWQQKSLEDVSTKTGLFDQVNLFLWHHSRRSNDDDDDVDDDDALDDDDSDSRLDELIIHLGRIAFEFLLEDRKKIVFSESDFKDVRDELEMGRKMGLVSKRTVTARQIKRGAPPSRTEIQFYHKLAQEHCASKYLAQLASEPSAMEDALKRMGGKEGVLVYENLLRFTCGESAAACAKVLQHIHGQDAKRSPLK